MPAFRSGDSGSEGQGYPPHLGLRPERDMKLLSPKINKQTNTHTITEIIVIL